MKILSILFLTTFLVPKYCDGCLVLGVQTTTSEFTSSSVGTTTTSGSTISNVSSSSSPEPRFSTSTIYEISSEGTEPTISDHTTISTGSTIEGGCESFCNDPDSILVSESTVFAKPEYKIFGSAWGDVCRDFFLTCKPEEGQICDNIQLYASKTENGSLIELATPNKTRVDATVPCLIFGEYLATDGASLIDEIFCIYTNCRMETTTTEEEPTTTMATTTIGENLCSTCQISDVFNYANSTDKVKPWYYDIATEDCSCKAHAVSCSLYTVDSCDLFAIQYIASDDQLYTLAETNGTLVEGEIQCLRNGKFGAGGRSIKELFCTHSGCKKMETATSIVE